MQINENKIKGKWLEIKGDIQKAWGSLTDNELEKTKGDTKSIRGLIQEKYGQTQNENDKKLSEILAKYGSPSDEALTNMKEQLKNQ